MAHGGRSDIARDDGHIRIPFTTLQPRRGEPKHSAVRSGDNTFSMPELETATPTGTSVTEREKRDAQRAQLRPLINRRPELYDDDEYSSAEYEKMMELYNGTLAS